MEMPFQERLGEAVVLLHTKLLVFILLDLDNLRVGKVDKQFACFPYVL